MYFTLQRLNIQQFWLTVYILLLHFIHNQVFGIKYFKLFKY